MKQTNHPKKTKSPITWVPTAYFAMGLPFVVLNMVTVLMFKGLGVEDKLITFWTSLILLPWTLKTFMESVSGVIQDKKILRYNNPANHWSNIRTSCVFVKLTSLFQYFHRFYWQLLHLVELHTISHATEYT